jgi:hypothetical protein
MFSWFGHCVSDGYRSPARFAPWLVTVFAVFQTARTERIFITNRQAERRKINANRRTYSDRSCPRSSLQKPILKIVVVGPNAGQAYPAVAIFQPTPSLSCTRTSTGFLGVSLLSAALSIPVVLSPVALPAQDRRNDDGRTIGIIAGRMNTTRLPEKDQQSYWNWRHNHSDAELRIEIR